LLPNPVLESLRLHAEVQLLKLSQGRNIAGMMRQTVPSVSAPALSPTPYRFSVLIERSKQLVNIALQIEASYLAALEKRDMETYNLMKAGFDLELAEAGEVLQGLRVTEATDSERLTALQRQRAEMQSDHFRNLIDAGLTELEQEALHDLQGALEAIDSDLARAGRGASTGAFLGGLAGGVTVGAALAGGATIAAATAAGAAAGPIGAAAGAVIGSLISLFAGGPDPSFFTTRSQQASM